MSIDPVEIPFDKVVHALLDEQKPFPVRYIYRLSDLEGADLSTLEKAWPSIPLRRKQTLLDDIQNMAEDDFLLDFTELGVMAMKDPDAFVRQLAVRTVSEYQTRYHVKDFIDLTEHDPDDSVRAEAASGLGVYVYMGEVEELPVNSLREVEDCLLRVMHSKDTAKVRRHALEALGFSSREEVPPLIEAAYHSDNHDWLVTSLIAMGRSSNPAWADQVMAKLDDRRSEVRAEAVAAAGELGLHAAVSTLLGLLEDEDDEVRSAAIWALSEIGGSGVRETLEGMLDQTEDEEEAQLVEDALENLAFVEDFDVFTLIDVDEDELPDGEGQGEDA